MFPLDSIIKNPNQVLFIISICLLLGFLIMNYKYIIQDYNPIYERLSYISKFFLGISVGFIVTLAAVTIFLSINTILSLFLKNSLIDSHSGIYILILSLAVGFLYFISMKVDKKNPFFIIKRLYRIILSLVFKVWAVVGILLISRNVYISPSKSLFDKTIKIIVIVYFSYLLLKLIQSAFHDHHKMFRRNYFFFEKLDFILDNVENLVSTIKKKIGYTKK